MEHQDLLFKEPVALREAPSIPGFRLELDYITPQEEQALLAHLENGPWQTDYRRRIQQYGLGYGSGNRQTPVWLRDFPDWLTDLASRVHHDAGFDRFPENCVINEYIPPLGIGPHRDYPDFGPIVACVSLGSDIVMNFTNPERQVRLPIVVPARSFWVVQGEARWQWTHGTPTRLTDVIHGERRPRRRRVSITFRTKAS